MAAPLLTAETAIERAAPDHQVVYQLLLIAQAEALEWAGAELHVPAESRGGWGYQWRVEAEVARLRKEAE